MVVPKLGRRMPKFIPKWRKSTPSTRNILSTPPEVGIITHVFLKLYNVESKCLVLYDFQIHENIFEFPALQNKIGGSYIRTVFDRYRTWGWRGNWRKLLGIFDLPQGTINCYLKAGMIYQLPLSTWQASEFASIRMVSQHSTPENISSIRLNTIRSTVISFQVCKIYQGPLK